MRYITWSFSVIIIFLLFILFKFDGAFVLQKGDLPSNLVESDYKPDSIAVYLINLDRAQERLNYVMPLASALGLDLHRFSAVDGAKLDPAYISSITDYNSYFRFFKKKPELGTIGCYLSHFQVWEKFLKSKYEYALILEDDISFSPEALSDVINQLMKKKQLWDIVNFDVHHRGGPIAIAQLDNGVELVVYKYKITNTGAYIINRHAAINLLRYKYPIKMPVDYLFTRSWEIGLKFTGVEPRLVRQNFGDSYISYHSSNKEKSLMLFFSSGVYELKSAAMRLFYALKHSYEILHIDDYKNETPLSIKKFHGQ